MRMPAILLLTGFLFSCSVQAGDKRAPVYPVLGRVQGNLLYVPTYLKEHETIPQQLFAYGGGKEFKAVLRKKDPYVALIHGDCDESWLGQYVYETQQVGDGIDVIVFDKQRDIQSMEKKMTDSSTQTEWQIIRVASNEGVHDVLRTTKEGKCVGHVDYYTHCNFDTEPDSEQAFEGAMCGKETSEFATGF